MKTDFSGNGDPALLLLLLLLLPLLPLLPTPPLLLCVIQDGSMASPEEPAGCRSVQVVRDRHVAQAEARAHEARRPRRIQKCRESVSLLGAWCA